MSDSERPGSRSFSDPQATSSAIQRKIISPDALNEFDKAVINGFIEHVSRQAGSQGVLVGAIKGESDWDIRPLFLDKRPEGASLTIVRFTDPQLLSEEKTAAELRRTFAVVGSDSSRFGVLCKGEYEGKLWVRRYFYPHTLADVFSLEDPFTPPVPLVSFVQGALGIVESLRSNGIVHGHICAENLAFRGGEAVLIDVGYSGFRPVSKSIFPSLAPEVVGGGLPSPASDVFGLGQILKQVLGNAVLPQQAKVIDAMMDVDPGKRPSVEEVTGIFLSGSKRGPSAGYGVSSKASGGRFLGREVFTVTPSKPDKVEPPRDIGVTETVVISKADMSAVFELAKKKVEEKKATPDLASSWNYMWVGALVLILLVAFKFLPLGDFFRSSSERQEEYIVQWSSGQPVSMGEVAKAAVVDGDELAQGVIVADVLSGNTRGNIRPAVVKLAFDPRWESELSKDDRRIALMLATARLAPFDPSSLPPLSSAHPGVILAVIGDLPLGIEPSQFESIEVSKMAALPAPIGDSFKELDRMGIKDMGNVSARALCRIIAGDGSKPTVLAYMGEGTPEATFLSRILGLAGFIYSVPGLADSLYGLCEERNDIFARRVEWFDAEKIAMWDRVSKVDKISLVVGLLPGNQLTFEQYADLLRYPAATVRKETQKKLLIALPNRDLDGMLAFLGGGENQLSRLQVVSLLLSFKLEGDGAYAFLSRWFGSTPEPDPQTVLELLIERNREDPFSVEAARYLVSKDWSASLVQIQRLVRHPEPMARALAYSRLDPSVPAEAALLKEGVKSEPNTKIRDEIVRKLTSGVQE